MRGRTGSVPEISVFPTQISVIGLEILPYEPDFSPVTGMNGGMNFDGPDGIVLHCLLHVTVLSIPFSAVIQLLELPKL